MNTNFLHGRSFRPGRLKLELPIILLLASLPFLAALNRGLVSEDFIILRRLWEQPFWSMFREQFCGPWMGVRIVLFWRPVSTLILQIEELLWGVQPLPYLCVQLAFHLLSVGLLYALAGRLFPGRKWAARGVSLIFALYPLHPNSVLFIASFATVFATTFAFASMYLFIRWRETGKMTWLIGSLGALAMSLMSYEASFVLPILILVIDLVRSRDRGETMKLTGLLRSHGPFFALSAAYLGLRYLLLGTTIGGYSGSSFHPSSLLSLLGHLKMEWSSFFFPLDERLPMGWEDAGILGALGAAAVALAFKGRRRSDHLLLGLIWILVARLPFGQTKVVPANGRYWYLASAGIGLVLIGLSELFSDARRKEAFVCLFTILTASAYGLGLGAFSLKYSEASALAKMIASEISTLRDSVDSDKALFLLGVPTYLQNSRGRNVAQVFAWGLSDSMLPPFSHSHGRVFSLGSLESKDVVPLSRRSDLGSVWKWKQKGFHRVESLSSELQHIEISGRENPSRDLRYRAPGNLSCRLFIVGSMQTMDLKLPRREDWSRLIPPMLAIQSDQHLYGAELYLWIAGWNSEGRLAAVSELLVLPPPEGPVEARRAE